MASLTSSSTPTPSSASSYNLVVLNNRQVTITKFNTTENETEINEINQFNTIMKSGRTSNLGLVGVSNRPLTIKKMQEDWIKINKAIPQSTTEYKPEDFDFKKAADTNVNTYLIRVNKNLDKMILWLQTFVDRYGALEAAKTLATECDVALTPMHINRSSTLQKLEMMNIRYNAANQLHLTDDTKTALFRGTLKSKIKILKKSTASGERVLVTCHSKIARVYVVARSTLSSRRAERVLIFQTPLVQQNLDATTLMNVCFQFRSVDVSRLADRS